MVDKNKKIPISIRGKQNRAMKESPLVKGDSSIGKRVLQPQQIVHSSKVMVGSFEDISGKKKNIPEQTLETINRITKNPKVIDLDDNLRSLKLNAMRESFADMINGIAPPSEEFIDNFHNLVTSQKSAKELASLNNIIKNAKFVYNSATVEQITYDQSRKLNKEEIDRLASCGYIKNRTNVCIFGATGAGKTFLSCALGMAAAQRLYKVRYFRLPQLLNFLMGLSSDIVYKEIAKLKRFDLVIIDEFLNYQIEEKQSRLLLELLEDRREKSFIFVSICLPHQWLVNLGGNAPLAESIVDRIVHKTHNIKIAGDKSMRENERPQNL